MGSLQINIKYLGFSKAPKRIESTGICVVFLSQINDLTQFNYVKMLFGSLKKYSIIFGIAIYPYLILAQKVPGSSNTMDQNYKFTQADTMAGIIILKEHGYVDFPNTSYLNYHYEIQYKFLKDTVLPDSFFTIPYQVKDNIIKENISDIRVSIYTFEKNLLKKTIIPKQNISDHQVNEHSYQKVIKVPKLSSGCTLVFSYNKQTPFAISTDPESWYFEKQFPVKVSEFALLIPSYLHYENKGYGNNDYSEKLEIDTNMAGVVGLPTKVTFYKYVMRDLPQRKNNMAIPFSDCAYKRRFILKNTTYPNKPAKISNSLRLIDSTLRENFEKFVLQTSDLKNVNFKMYTTDTNGIKKLNKVFRAVLLGLSASRDSFNQQTANLVLMKALREAGFDCQPIFLNRNENIDTSFLTLADFNYQISHVNLDGKNMYVDITDSLTVFGLLPNYLIHKNGRLVSSSYSGWVEIDSDKKILHLENITAEISGNGRIDANYSSAKDQYATDSLRFTEQVRSLGDVHYTDLKYKNEASLTQMKASYKFNFQTIISNNDICFYPIIPLQFIDDYFKNLSSDCSFDWKVNVDHSYIATFKLPSDYYVSGAPTSEVITLLNGDAKFSYILTKKDNYLHLSCRLSTYKTKFQKSDYAQVKSFYDQILSKQNGMVILKKEK